MTLLALQLEVPSIPAGLPSQEIGRRLATGLAELGPAYYSFVISFFVVATYWIAHHRKLLYLARHDAGLIWLNMLLLLCIVFIPFPTAVLGRYHDQPVAAVFYAVTLVTTGLVSTAMTAYAGRRRLGDPTADPRLLRYAMARSLVVPAVFLASILLAVLDPVAAE